MGRTNAINRGEKRKFSDEDDAVEAIILMRKGENPSDVITALKAKIEPHDVVMFRLSK